MKRAVVPFGNDTLRLRLIGESDLALTRAWRNRDQVRVWFKTSAPISPEQHQAWFESYRERDDDFVFIIEAEGESVGQASVYGIDWHQGVAEIGRFLVAPEWQGRGYIGRACEALVAFCGGAVGLTYLFLEVLDGNSRAISLYERNGFCVRSRDDGLVRLDLRLARARPQVSG